CGASTAPATAAVRPSAAEVATVASYKAGHDTEAAQVRSQATADATHNAQKQALVASGKLTPTQPVAAKAGRCANASTVFTADSVIGWLYQYDQVRGSFCGPATVAEMSATVPGASAIGLDQYGIANYMTGDWTLVDARGTNIDEEVYGLNGYVGVPDFGWNFYGFVGMDYSPTAAQRSAFESNLASDLAVYSPVAGDAWEVPGGPHLVGHPNQEIFHYFEIGGQSGSQVLYADSAHSVWASVPAYSWQDTYTVETILGGRGYIW
ncbi:MAG: hypothetical protein J2P15_16580, partial [Micromonosporaceae bacterium]|nr:hypothetical protein [Micromonosporaceae bacterium]